MPPLLERQRVFGDVLLDPGQPLPGGILGPGGKPSQRRFNVYRNNVIAGLIGALEDCYPVVARIVGDEFFAAMARQYVRSHLPANPMMFTYGDRLPAFIEGFAPAASLPYLPGVARIEWAWIEAYHSPEATPLDPRLLPALEPFDLRVEFHPSLRIVRSAWPIFTIWNMHTQEGALHEVSLDAGSEDVLIVRPDWRVGASLLPAGAAQLVGALRSGVSLTMALSGVMSASADFDFAAALSLLLETGAIIDIRPRVDTALLFQTGVA